MSSFRTNNGITFTVDMKTKDVRAVKELVKYPDGKPVDILEATETGTLAGIYGDIAVLVDVMFTLCIDQVKEHFDLQKYEEQNQKTFALFPDQATEPPLMKASRWFGSIIGGNALIEMVNAFNEAVVNFTPNENRRAALRAILEKERETERLEAEYRIKTVNLMFDKAKANLGKRWEMFGEQEILKLVKQLDGQFGVYGSLPESAESILPISPFGN